MKRKWEGKTMYPGELWNVSLQFVTREPNQNEKAQIPHLCQENNIEKKEEVVKYFYEPGMFFRNKWMKAHKGHETHQKRENIVSKYRLESGNIKCERIYFTQPTHVKSKIRIYLQTPREKKHKKERNRSLNYTFMKEEETFT